jgi:hypothetical protein
VSNQLDPEETKIAASPEADGADPVAEESGEAEIVPGLTVDRVKHGVYYVLPDSGESFTASLWERVDRNALEDSWAQIVEDATADLDEAERKRPDVLGGSVFYVPRAERELLSSVGGEQTKAALALFDELDRQSGWKISTGDGSE